MYLTFAFYPQLDMSKYPYDVSVCPVTIHAWMSDNFTMAVSDDMTVTDVMAVTDCNGNSHDFFPCTKKVPLSTKGNIISNKKRGRVAQANK